MRDIKFDAIFGDEVKKVRVSLPFGGGGWGINIDGWHCKTIINRGQFGWWYYGKLEIEDVQAILDRIIEATNAEPALINY